MPGFQPALIAPPAFITQAPCRKDTCTTTDSMWGVRPLGRETLGYNNSACNDGFIAAVVAFLLNSQPYDYCLSVDFYRDPDAPQQTLIELQAQWSDG